MLYPNYANSSRFKNSPILIFFMLGNILIELTPSSEVIQSYGMYRILHIKFTKKIKFLDKYYQYIL